jgi:hypothetical protein
MLSNGHETTLYSEGTLLPAPEVADWEALLRRPELFSVAGCRIVGPRLAIVERLAHVALGRKLPQCRLFENCCAK